MNSLIRRVVFFIVGGIVLGGCGASRVSISRNPTLKQHFAQDQIASVTVVSKQIGTKKTLFGKRPLMGEFLEGTIIGALTNWDGKPIEGVVVRGAWMEAATPNPDPQAQDLLIEQSMSETDDGVSPQVANASAIESVSDHQGQYKVHFSVPIIKNKVGIQGKLQFNPGWEEQLKDLGRSYEPFLAEIPMVLFYDANTQLLAFNTGALKFPVQIHERKLVAKTTEPQAEPVAKPLDKEKKKLSTKNEWMLGLQIILVQYHLDNIIQVDPKTNAIDISMNSEAAFDAQGRLTAETEKGLLALADWMANFDRTATLTSPRSSDTTMKSKIASLQGLFKRKVVGIKQQSSPDLDGHMKISMNF